MSYSSIVLVARAACAVSVKAGPPESSFSGFDECLASANKVGRVGVVGVQMEFGQITGIDFQPDILKGESLVAADVSANGAASPEPHIRNVHGTEMEVPHGADGGRYGKGPLWAHKSDPLGALQVARVPHWGIET